MIVHTSNHPQGKVVRFLFSIRPKDIMGEFVEHHINPFSLRVVLSPFLPVLRMYQMDFSVRICYARGLSPINILEPVYLRHSYMVETAEI